MSQHWSLCWECTAKGTHDGKNKRDSFYQEQEAGKQEKNQIGLLTMDDGIVNWGEHTEVEETNHALMAISSSNEVSLCSKLCIDSYNTLKTLCDKQMNQLGDQEAQILAYSQAVKKLEAQLSKYLIKDCDYYKKENGKRGEVKNKGLLLLVMGWHKPSKRVNTGSSNVNTVRSRQPVPTKTSNSFSPKRPQGNWGSAVKTSAGYNWRNSNSNCDSGPTFIRTVNAKVHKATHSLKRPGFPKRNTTFLFFMCMIIRMKNMVDRDFWEYGKGVLRASKTLLPAVLLVVTTNPMQFGKGSKLNQAWGTIGVLCEVSQEGEKLEGILKEETVVFSGLEEEVPEDQGREGRNKLKNISPTTFEKLKSLSRVASQESQINRYGKEWEVSTDSINSPFLPAKGQREGNASMIIEEDILRRLENKFYRKKLVLLKPSEEEGLNKQQKKRRAQVQFEAQHYTYEDWDLIRAKIEAIAVLQRGVLGKGMEAIQLKNLSFEEMKEEFDKLVKQVESFAPINFEKIWKGLHSDKADEDESEDSKDDDPISGTNIPINPVLVAIKPPSIATYSSSAKE
ncbi:hypothetical protein Tco_1319337 [Tanacetum coccineum]